MVRMVIETRADPRLCVDEEGNGRTGRGRSGHTRPTRSRRVSRARSPSQQFASRVYWREVTANELRRLQLAKPSQASSQHSDLSDAASCGAQVEANSSRPPAVSLNTLLENALQQHIDFKLDERLRVEWELVESSPEPEDYVLV